MIKLFRSVVSVAVGLALGLLVTTVAGENPIHILKVLFKSSFGSAYDFGMTLFYTTPLIFTGLAVAIPYRAGLFNIGAEGQLTLGALATTVVGIYFPNLSFPFSLLLATLAGFLVGAIWGAIPGWLKAQRGSHEVINTIMFNFMAAGIASYVTLYLIRNQETQNPESLPVGPFYKLSHFSSFGDAPVSFALIVAILCAVLIYFFLRSTVMGFELRAVGESETVSQTSGISVKKIQILSMFLGGGMAGLVGLAEVLGNSGKFKLEFSPGYGFIGIAVALLARGQPLLILGAAFLFGALHKGTSDLDIETDKITRDVSAILQALIILSVSAEIIWERLIRKK